jgi:hypothetical protein
MHGCWQNMMMKIEERTRLLMRGGIKNIQALTEIALAVSKHELRTAMMTRKDGSIPGVKNKKKSDIAQRYQESTPEESREIAKAFFDGIRRESAYIPMPGRQTKG